MDFRLSYFGSAVALIACALASITPSMAQQAYPNKPIRLIVPLPAGGTSDFMARALGSEMAKQLGQPVVIENRAGAGGSIGMAETAHAMPDGYTVTMASQGSLVFKQSLYAKPGYDSVRDFAPVAWVGSVANVLVVLPDSTLTTVAGLVNSAKARPGALNYSSAGGGTSQHLSGALFNQLIGANVVHVPYKGAAQGIMAIMSGEVDMGFYNTNTVLSQIKAGKLKALAVTSLTRSALLPAVPTIDSSGVRGFEVNTWFSLVAPAATPAHIVEKLSNAAAKALASPAVRALWMEQGVDQPRDTSPKVLAQMLDNDLNKWPAIIKTSGAKIE